MQSYAEYKREFMKDWTRKISKAAGVAEGRGKRGELLMKGLLKELDPTANDDQLHAFRYKWMRWKAGRQTPSLHDFRKLHARAVMLRYLGQGTGLRAIQERYGMMSQEEWRFGPEFEFQERQDELWEQLDRLDQEEKKIKKEKESLGAALGVFEQPQWLSPLERAEQLELEATALRKEAAEIRETVRNVPRGRLRTVRSGCLTRFFYD